ncbi:hypothetical protein Tco_1316223 [Tanacetum coccineum]
MAFKHFMYVENDEDLSFLPKEPSPEFGTGSSSVLINTKPPVTEVKPTEQLIENMADSRDSPVHQEKLVIHSGSVIARIKDKKCRTRRYLKPHVKHAELLNLHDCCYASQAVVDDAINRRAQELLKVVEQMKREYFDNNLAVNVLRKKIMALSWEVKEHKGSLDRMLLESKKWVGYQESLKTIESKVTTLEAEKKRAKVISMVVPYIAMELVHSNELGMLVGKLVSSTVFYERCVAFEDAAEMKEPFDLTNEKGYRPSYKNEHTKASNDLATATFPFLSEVVADPSASVKALISKKPPSLQRLALTRTHAPAPLAPSQKATPSSDLVS